MMFTVNKNPSLRDLHKFGWAMLIGFGVLAVLLWLAPWVKARDVSVLTWSAAPRQIVAVVLLGLGLGLLVLSRAAPRAARTVYVGWMTAAVPIGVAMSMVLLTVLFVFLLPVFSLIVRLGDPLRKKLRGDTYWEDYKPHEPSFDRMRRLF